jgi:Bacteriophage Sf6, terminase small subunit-like
MATAKKRGAPASAPVRQKKLTRKEKSAINKAVYAAKQAAAKAERQARFVDRHKSRIVLAKELRPNPANPKVVHPDDGRKPTAYTKELGDRICYMFSTDPEMSLLRMNADPTLPTVGSFYGWLRDNEDLAKMYHNAREMQQDLKAAEMEEWTKTPLVGTIRTVRTGVDFKGKPIESEEVREIDNVDRARLMVETRKWILAKERPKKYGLQPIDVADNGPLQELLAQFRARSKELEGDGG